MLDANWGLILQNMFWHNRSAVELRLYFDALLEVLNEFATASVHYQVEIILILKQEQTWAGTISQSTSKMDQNLAIISHDLCYSIGPELTQN